MFKVRKKGWFVFILVLIALSLFTACANEDYKPSENAAAGALNTPAVNVPAADCVVDPANVLNNPGFEDGTTGWFLFTGGDVGTFSTSGPAYECNFAARLNFSGSSGGMFFRQKDFTLQPNTNYVLSYAAYSTGGFGFGVVLEKDDRSANYGVDEVANLTGSWQTFTYPFSTGADVSNPQLRFALAGRAKAGDVYWIDDVNILPVN